MDSDLFGEKPRKDPGRTAEVRRWAADALGLEDGTTVLVTELRCSEPGCPPLETVVAVLAEASAAMHTIHKPLADVTRDDVLALARRRKGDRR